MFNFYVIIILLVMFIEFGCGMLTVAWLKNLIDAQAKVLLFMSLIPSFLAIVFAELGSLPISMASIIVSVVIAVYALVHKMSDVNGPVTPEDKLIKDVRTHRNR